MQAQIGHLAVWVHDLETMRRFYVEALGGESGSLYENPTTGFRSYFVSLGPGARLELMCRPGLQPRPAEPAQGYAHLALTLGSQQAVDAAIAALREQGVTIDSEPRFTGDGYYEAVISDPEGNLVELTA